MRSRLTIPASALFVTTLLAVAAHSVGQDIKLEIKKPYDPSRYQTLSGTINFTGRRPKTFRIDTSADPICTKLNPELKTEWTEGNRGKLANVFVYVESESLQTYSYNQPTTPAALEHKDCRYVPRMLGVRVGQPLTIMNNDSTVHNTHPTPKLNVEWNQSQRPDSEPLMKTFPKPERFIPFKDNQHPWEKAYVGVFEHPFFGISDQQGSFRIEGLPPGQYKVVAWHESLGEKTVDITFLPDEARHLTFTFTALEP